MNREGFKENVKIALMLAGIFALVATPIAIAGYFLYQFTATVESDEAKAYLDAACTTEVPKPHDWGSITTETLVTVWIKNIGTVTVDVTLTISGETDCTVTPSWTATTLAVSEVQPLDMTISTTATPGTSISWNLDINSNKSP